MSSPIYPADYNGGVQVEGVCATSDGAIWLGFFSEKCVRRYDGFGWKKFPVNDRVASICVDADDGIWIATPGKVGLLHDDGSVSWRTLNGNSMVYGMLFHDGHVYGRTPNSVFRINTRSLKVFEFDVPDGKNVTAFGVHKGHVMVGLTGSSPLFRIEDQRLAPRPGYQDMTIHTLMGLKNGDLFVLARGAIGDKIALHAFINGDHRSQSSQLTSFFWRHEGAQLPDGTILVPAFDRLARYSPSGQLLQQFQGEDYPMLEETCRVVVNDQGIAWVGTAYGIMRLHFTVGVGELLKSKMPEHVEVCAEYQGALYLVASDGAYRLDGWDSPGNYEVTQILRYLPDGGVKESTGEGNDLAVSHDELLLATRSGVYRIEGTNAIPYYEEGSHKEQIVNPDDTDNPTFHEPLRLCPIQDDTHLVFVARKAGGNAIAVLDKAESKVRFHQLTGLFELTILEGTPRKIWLKDVEAWGQARVTVCEFEGGWNGDFKIYHSEDDSWLGLGKTQKLGVIGIKRDGVYALSHTDQRKIESVKVVNWAVEETSQISHALVVDERIFLFTSDGLAIWGIENGEAKKLKEVAVQNDFWQTQSLSRPTMKGDRFWYPRIGKSVVFGNIEGSALSQPATVNLRFRRKGKQQRNQDIEFDPSLTDTATFELKPDEKLIASAAPSELFNESRNRFRFTLRRDDGSSPVSTEWSVASQHTYYDLPEGNYKLTVEATGFRDFGSVEHSFRVLPAWYETLPGRLAIAAGSLLGIVAFVRLRNRSVHRTATRLAAQLSDTEYQFQSLFRESTGALAVTKPDGTILDANAACQTLLQEADLKNTSIYDYLIDCDSNSPDLLERARLRLATSDDTVDVETRKKRIGDSMLWSIQDLTKSDEDERYLKRSAAIEAMGYMASSFAHDVRNVFSAVTLSNDVIERMTAENEFVAEAVKNSNNAIRHGTELANELMRFGKDTESAELVPTEITKIVREVVRSFQSTSLQIQTSCKLPVEPVYVLGDRDLILRVLVNTFSNAVQSIESGGTVAIELKCPTGDSGSFVDVTVTDTGSGIAPDLLTRIWDPYFTTKSTGTGLGLYSIRDTMKRLHGEARVTSELGSGTAMSLRFLQTRRTESPAIAVKSDKNLRVLAVDDDAASLSAVATPLRIAGLDLVSTTDSSEAAELLNTEQFDVLVTDLMMSPCSGLELAKTARNSNPKCKVLILTGYIDVLKEHGLRDARLVDHVLTKPTTWKELMDAILRVETAGHSTEADTRS